MLTRLELRNFKQFGNADIDLGKSVVFIGPNNSGKTTALQALALWNIGLRQWYGKRGEKPVPRKRLGVTINRRDLVSIPITFRKADYHILARFVPKDRIDGEIVEKLDAIEAVAKRAVQAARQTTRRNVPAKKRL